MPQSPNEQPELKKGTPEWRLSILQCGPQNDVGGQTLKTADGKMDIFAVGDLFFVIINSNDSIAVTYTFDKKGNFIHGILRSTKTPRKGNTQKIDEQTIKELDDYFEKYEKEIKSRHAPQPWEEIVKIRGEAAKDVSDVLENTDQTAKKLEEIFKKQGYKIASITRHDTQRLFTIDGFARFSIEKSLDNATLLDILSNKPHEIKKITTLIESSGEFKTVENPRVNNSTSYIKVLWLKKKKTKSLPSDEDDEDNVAMAWGEQ